MIWQFKINGTEVDEPIGWDAVAITLTRSVDYWGLENIYSDNITFWDSGADIIRTAYEADGIDADLTFEANYDCGDGAGFVPFVSGILNCFFYQILNNQVTVKIEPSGFHRDIKNNIDTPINILSNKSIDGSPLSAFTPFDLGLHSKVIVQQGAMDVNPALTDQSVLGVNDASFNAIYVPMQIITDEFKGLNEGSIIFDIQPAVGPYISQPLFTAPIAGDYTFTYDLDLTIYETTTVPRIFDMEMAFGFNGANVSVVSPATHHSQNGGTISVVQAGSGTFTLHMNAGEYMYLFTALYNSTPNRSADLRQVVRKANFSVYSKGVYKPSTCKAFLIHEVFAILAESMTGIQDCFRSDYFGQTNSFPHQYSAAGCGAWSAITNGLAIRKMLNKNGALYNISTTFKEFFENVDAIFNIGMRVQIENGREILRVEPKEYFFNSSKIFSVFSVSDMNKTPAVEYIYNTYDNGYDKWNLNITGSNAIDEFNSKHSYTLPVKKSNTGLIKISKFIASGYLIEQTRRLQFLTYPTNDFETDNDLFIICTNRTEITSDKYTTPNPIPTIYAAGMVSERDENFTGVTNVLDVPSNYNYRISPTRIAANWYKWISGSIFKHPDRDIRFVSAQGNYLEGDTMINDCVTISTVEQNQNMVKSEINIIDSTPIFNPEYLTFTYPISFDQFVNILANAEKAIGVSCSSGSQYAGFILSMKYGMNANGSMAEFKVITSGQCISGDFNNDFNNDYFKGNC